MSEAPADEGLPPSLRVLKWLVIALTLTMIGGVIAVVWLLVTRMPVPAAAPRLPDTIEMPANTTAEAVTYGKGWIAIATTDGRLLLFSSAGKLRQEILLTQETDKP